MAIALSTEIRQLVDRANFAHLATLNHDVEGRKTLTNLALINHKEVLLIGLLDLTILRIPI